MDFILKKEEKNSPYKTKFRQRPKPKSRRQKGTFRRQDGAHLNNIDRQPVAYDMDMKNMTHKCSSEQAYLLLCIDDYSSTTGLYG